MQAPLQARSGAQSLRATSRPDANQFAVYNLTGRVQAGSTYAVSAWTWHTGGATDTVRLAAKVGCASGDSFPWLHNNTTVAPGSLDTALGEPRDPGSLHGRGCGDLLRGHDGRFRRIR